MQLTLVPFQGVAHADVLNLAGELRKSDFDVDIGTTISVPQRAYNQRRDQYMADILFKELYQFEGERVLGITDTDIYRYVLRCVYGVADLPGRIALISLYRLHVTQSKQQYQQRMNKLAIHELGHTHGLEHCKRPRCVMQFSASLEHLDASSAAFCDTCKTKLMQIQEVALA